MSPLTETLLYGGFVGALPLWEYFLIGYVRGQVLVMSVSLYFHRATTHRSIEIHPVLAVLMHFSCWCAQTSKKKQWEPTHIKHHRFTDDDGDPHSPKHHSLWSMLLAIPYRKVAKDPDTIQSYGRNTPEDWFERNLFAKYPRLGILVLAIGLVSVFGLVPGGLLWLFEVSYIPITAMVGVNGIGHLWGYRNADTDDNSRNVLPIDFLTFGELLHNNHHADPASAKMSHKWWEFDPGWGFIVLSGWVSALIRLVTRSKTFELIRVIRVYRPPKLVRSAADLEVGAIHAFERYVLQIRHRFQTKVQPVLEHLKVQGTKEHPLQAEFDELCKRARSPSAPSLPAAMMVPRLLEPWA